MDTRFNHSKGSTQDKIALISELEHKRYHNLRTMRATKDEKEKFVRAVWATQAQTIRRELMAKWFPDVAEDDWCDLKVSSRIEQLAFETFDGDIESFERLLTLCDDSIGHILHQDVSGCEACKKELEAIKKADSSEEESA